MDESQKDKFAGQRHWALRFRLLLSCHILSESELYLFSLGQDVVFQCLGESLLDNAFLGYNACIFAYGQTGNLKAGVQFDLFFFIVYSFYGIVYGFQWRKSVFGVSVLCIKTWTNVAFWYVVYWHHFF